jgi:hypothetical protein
MILLLALALVPQEPPDLKAVLSREVLGKRTSLEEIQAFIEPRIPVLPELSSAAEWDRFAARLREGVLDRVVFRGEASRWRERAPGVAWEGDAPGGSGYAVRKLRYEAVPGLWIPALLYRPERLEGRVPVHLAVNGHDGKGKAADYKQARCINLAKRGMIVLNLEWIGMGQLRGPGYGHYGMNQLDLCGTGGLAPFYLSMRNALDLLLSLEHADPSRVAVSGLSGGGWQTIVISALDPRVTLSNPVAGYSSFRTRVRHLKDLGDSEQTPSDLATVADYAHLTAMRAPRPTLLTYNGKDNCCFEAGYALEPLLDAARPAFRAFRRETHLRSHVNVEGDHNFGLENREAFYRAVGDFFYPGSKGFDPKEIPCAGEIRTAAELDVPLPPGNATFHSLALELSKGLPRAPELPADPEAARLWREARRLRLREVLRAREWTARAEEAAAEKAGELTIRHLRLRMGDDFTVPATVLEPREPRGTALLFSETGRAALGAQAARLLGEGRRVVAFDPFYAGESKIASHDFLFALLVAAVGERPLGIQAAQVAAVARWAGPAEVVAAGPRASLAALCAAGLEERSITRLELHQSYGSLREVVERNVTVNQAPELFCFGLLEAFDVKQLAALAAPRPVSFAAPGERARKELADLEAYYALLGTEFDPLR